MSGVRLWMMVAAGLAVGGCGGGQRGEPVNTGLSTLAGDQSPGPRPVAPLEVQTPAEASLSHLAQQSAVNLQSVLDELAAREKGPAPAAAGPSNDDPGELDGGGVRAMRADPAEPGAVAYEGLKGTDPAEPGSVARGSVARGSVARGSVAQGSVARGSEGLEGADPAEPGSVAQGSGARAEPRKTVAERIEEHSIALVDLLRQRAAGEDEPRRTYLALAALEALRPGAAQQLITPEAVGADPLTRDDRAVVDGVRELVGSLTGAKDGAAFAAIVREFADRVTMSQPVRIGRALLCTRVSGYGKFSILPSLRLLQGREQRAVVYVEVASFGQRPATEAEANGAGVVGIEARPRWTVDLTQELLLYHDADGVLAWTRSEEPVVESSANRRRDFYTVQHVALPATLTVGAYRLKVVIRDRTTGARDEAAIALEVVADPSLALRGGD